jgi:hypothetical protein
MLRVGQYQWPFLPASQQNSRQASNDKQAFGSHAHSITRREPPPGRAV